MHLRLWSVPAHSSDPGSSACAATSLLPQPPGFLYPAPTCAACTPVRCAGTSRSAARNCATLTTGAAPTVSLVQDKETMPYRLWPIHLQSTRSVFFRPGTRANSRVFTSTTSSPCLSRISCGGIQYTPVLSIATDSTFLSFNHSAIFSNSGVVAPKCSTSRPGSYCFGAHTQCCVLPRSVPATLGRTTGRPSTSISWPDCLLVSRLICILLFAFPNTTARVGQTGILV